MRVGQAMLELVCPRPRLTLWWKMLVWASMKGSVALGSKGSGGSWKAACERQEGGGRGHTWCMAVAPAWNASHGCRVPFRPAARL